MTLKTDYEKIADRYDRNEIRVRIPPDPRIAALADGAAILDLACGTGGYLASQAMHFADRKLGWHGVDASVAMLAAAKKKGVPSELKLGTAEALPYADATFDYVVCRFAFHHFSGKAGAVREMARILKPGGAVRIQNLAPELSGDWWLYKYFPEAVAIDEKRFWPLQRLEAALEAAGLSVTIKTEKMARSPLRMFYDEAMNRETSELVLMDDLAYARGMAALAADHAREPNALIDPGLTLVEVVAVR